jgi:hypothetical protein
VEELEANLDKLKNKLEGKIQDVDEFISLMHHRFMKEYGYIPIDEFLSMPLGTFQCLLEHMQEDAKEMKRSMKK